MPSTSAKIATSFSAVQPDALLKRGDVSVGVVATISPAVIPGIPPSALKGLVLEDPASSARAAIRGLRKRIKKSEGTP